MHEYRHPDTGRDIEWVVCYPGQGEIAFTVFVALSVRARAEVIGNLWRLGICTGGIARQNPPRSTGYAAFRASISPVPIAERLSALCCHRADRRRGGQRCGRAAVAQ